MVCVACFVAALMSTNARYQPPAGILRPAHISVNSGLLKTRPLPTNRQGQKSQPSADVRLEKRRRGGCLILASGDIPCAKKGQISGGKLPWPKIMESRDGARQQAAGVPRRADGDVDPTALRRSALGEGYSKSRLPGVVGLGCGIELF